MASPINSSPIAANSDTSQSIEVTKQNTLIEKIKKNWVSCLLQSICNGTFVSGVSLLTFGITKTNTALVVAGSILLAVAASITSYAIFNFFLKLFGVKDQNNSQLANGPLRV